MDTIQQKLSTWMRRSSSVLREKLTIVSAFSISGNKRLNSANSEELEMDIHQTKVKFAYDNEVFELDEPVSPEPVLNYVKLSDPEPNEPVDPVWDVFAETPVDNFAHNNPFLRELCMILLKVLVGVFLFGFVLITAILSRLSLLEIVQQVRLVNISLPLAPEQQRTCHLQSARFNKSVSKDIKHVPPVLQVYWIWALFLIVCFPYGIGIFRSLWKILFKKTKSVSKYVLLSTILIETLHSLGLLMLIFIVLASLDPVRSSMLIYGVGLIPCILEIFPVRKTYIGGSYEQLEETSTASRFTRLIWRLISLLVAIFIAALLIFFYAGFKNDNFYPTNETNFQNIFYIAPISLVLISIKYWDLFSDRVCSIEFEKEMKEQNTRISLLVSMLKIIYTLIFLYVFYGTGSKNCGRVLFVQGTSINATNCGLQKVTLSFSYMSPEPFIYASVNMLSGFFCFQFSKTACQLLAQRFSFSLPLVLTGPLSTLLVLFFTSQGLPFLKMTPRDTPPLLQRDTVGFLSCYYKDITIERIFVFGFYISFLYVIRHVWMPKVERLAKADKLFTSVIYCGALLDQSLMLSRLRDVKRIKPESKRSDKSAIRRTFTAEKMRSMKDTPLIYACATMWHENENEMIQLLKSIFRMDLDQATRAYMKDNLGITDNDYYEFEAHIFFDDAFAFSLDTANYVINNYVKLLLKCIPLACKAIHTDIEMSLPKKVNTPYGGRLEWVLPGANKMVVHLKNKDLIRHKKRWSQVMYMYYFLGKQIFSQKVSNSVKERRADNTFLLALDGDVDFEPSAVLLLVDRMKRNPKVGAACGRIHPIGSGPMVWYQKFEYAISHWLQKATEHMIGCVLCSPGCFSLFRGSALAADNVLKRYTTLPSEAKHHVQYDQGEDRWLCTLLLQQGFRVEYCAASDALTYCPETFNEFFKQRRRWAPSTMANIIDLLMDWRNVRIKNDSISMLYIFYQTCLMATSILTPGTIFMLVVGALHSAYDITLTNSLIINLIPVILMILLCFLAKEDTQLQFASVMSVLYAAFMMLVVVGLMREIGTYLFCSVTTILFSFVVGTFVLSAIFHPKEFFCLLHGLLYFLLIPSMSMLMMFYALGNLQNVSWGTRESQTEQAAKAKVAEEVAKAKTKIDSLKGRKQSTIDRFQNFFTSLGSGKKQEMDSEYNFSCGSIFRCLCFPKQAAKSKDDLLEPLLNRFDEIVRMRSEEFAEMMKDRKRAAEEIEEKLNQVEDDKENTEQQETKKKTENFLLSNDRINSNPLFTPEWMNDETLKDLETEFIERTETNFWRKLIDQYLFPVDKDELREKKMHENLVVLRNNVCMFFCLVNALFVIIVFTIEFSISNSSATSFKLCNDSDIKTKDTNVISIVFMLVFGITLLIQLMAMLFHRYETFKHILASINITPNLMSKLETHNFWRELSATERDQSDIESVTSDLSECSIRDRRPPRQYHRQLFRKQRPKSLMEKMDSKFSSTYDQIQRSTSFASKKGPTPTTAAQMSWMLILNDPRIKRTASIHREGINKKWERAIKTVILNKVRQSDGTTKTSSSVREESEGLNTIKEEQVDSLGLTTLDEDQLDSGKNDEKDNSGLVSVIVHADKDSLELDSQEMEAFNQNDSDSTRQRDPDMDQNGAQSFSQEMEAFNQNDSDSTRQRDPDMDQNGAQSFSQEMEALHQKDSDSTRQRDPDMDQNGAQSFSQEMEALHQKDSDSTRQRDPDMDQNGAQSVSQEMEALHQKDSDSTRQRVPDMDQNGAQLVSDVPGNESDRMLIYLKDESDSPQNEPLEPHKDDVSAFSENRSSQDSRSLSSEASTEQNTIQIIISSDEDEDITRF